MSVISAGTTLTTALVQTGDTNGNLVFKTGASGTTALTLGSDQSATFAGAVSFSGGAFAAGSASAPSITFTGDTNTGIFSPAADTIAFTEGGVESMRIDSAGNVGIGTSSPSYKLHVVGNTYLPLTYASYFYTTNYGIGTPNSDGLQIFTAANDYMRFGNMNAGTFTERMRLDSSGNLGLGVTPSAWSTASSVKAIQLGGGSLYSFNNDRIFIGQNVAITGAGNDTYINTAAASTYRQFAGVHAWYNAPSGTAGTNVSLTQAMTLDANGKLGIGVTSLIGRVDALAVPTFGTFVARSASAGANQDVIVTSAVDVGYSLFANAIYQGSGHRWQTSGSERMRIDSSGNVGIGTSSPSTRFEVNTGSGGTQNIATIRTANVQLKIGTTDLGNGEVTYNVFPTSNSSASGAHVWQGGGTERMRIDSSGNLLVGTTSNPVYGSTGARVMISKASGQWAIQTAVPSTGADGHIAFTNANGLVGFIETNGSSTIYSTSSDYRLKENIAPMTGAIATVAQLKPCTYTWKADGSSGQGFIAHELAEVVPDAVTGEKDAVNEDGSIKPQGIDTSFLVATLTAAIQEQQAIINDLKTRIEQLEAK